VAARCIISAVNSVDNSAPGAEPRLAAAEGLDPDGLPSAEAFARLASELQDVDGVDETVDAVVQFAPQAVACTYASVVLITRGRRPEIMAATDPLLADLYRRQIDAGAGPLITAVENAETVLIRDTSAETRWSRTWSEQVSAAGIRSSIHLPLLVGNRALAVLSLYSDQPDAFTEDDLAVAHILARHASVAIAAARQEATMAQAIDARKLVGVAMGILMVTYDVDQDRAFTILKRYSQDTNTRLREVAQHVIDTRKLPH
jgi:transcriptional regulator with GAF, ATPase, and Fis domain